MAAGKSSHGTLEKIMRSFASLLTLAAALSAPHTYAAQPVEGYATTPDGVKLFYRAAGDGDAVVLLPGGMYLYDDFRRVAAGRRLIAYDQRNRGRSDALHQRTKLERGVLQDADDLEAVRRHFGAERVAIIAHSYMGLAAALYASSHPQHVSRFVQIGPPPPVYGKRYEPDTNSTDPVLKEVFAKLGELRLQGAETAPEELCVRVWEVLRPMYVAKRTDADKLASWGGCDLPNEQNAMQHYNANILPSMKTLRFTSDQLARADMPVLTIHGTRDRNAPYGGGREWASLLPDARLLTIDDAAHAPWIEAPEVVFGAIDRFLNGEWPKEALTPTPRPQERASPPQSREPAR
jgi:pimeloyl-ACP methyl ester carboxylesterase